MRYITTTIGLLFLLAQASVVHATPSTQIWIPSTDIQDFGVFHFGVDNYNTIFTKQSSGAWQAPTNYGLTVGVLPPEMSKVFSVEVGVDFREPQDDPLFFNAKVGVSEGGLFTNSPEFALGAYEFGGNSGVTNANIVYGLAAKSFGDTGRFSGGFYFGNGDVLVDENGKKDATGVLLSFDRSFGEKFWGAIDYMSGQSFYGALSFGGSYALSDKSSFIVGYDIYNNQSLAENTLTFQLDVDFN